MAELKLPAVIGDHMVVQRNQPVTLWGWADADAPVEVSLDTQTRKTKADKDGTWSVELKALESGGDPLTLTVKSGSQQVQATDILVGEVWVCSGQSNMQRSLHYVDNRDQEVAAANYLNIRFFDVPRKASGEPQDDVDFGPDRPTVWTVCTPGPARNFSAVAYFFGRDLHKELDVPIGLFLSYVGGTPSEAWTSRQSLESKTSLKPLLDRWDQQFAAWDPEKNEAKLTEWKTAVEKAKAEDKTPPRQPQLASDPRHSPLSPAGLYNAMIAPITRYSIAGAIWYQGERNVSRAYQYRTLFPLLIEDWRKQFAQPKMPFYFVQIAPYPYGAPHTKSAELREAQFLTLDKLKNTGMAVISDVGNIKDIHPTNKQDVGHRLALWALANTYGRSDLVFSGPLYKKVQFTGDKAIVHFDHIGSGLASRDTKPLSHFEIAGEDRVFHPATGEIDGKTVVVHSDSVKKPVAVRFAWHDIAESNLMNKEGLPASSFRTDTWKGVTEGVDY
ncbi:MAG: sialate O-acetylesterase [Chloroflexi bacterium]|nr:sialate O-acetylesterase [Chloroflexota bacterium]